MNSPIRYSDPSGHINEQGAGIGGGSIEDVYPGWWEHREEMIDQAMKWIAANQSSSPYDKLWTPTTMNTPSTPMGASSTQTPSTILVPGSTPSPTTVPNNENISPITITINWDEIDWIDFGVDVAGLAGDVSFAAGVPEAWAVTELVEIVGTAKTTYDLATGDPSNAFLALLEQCNDTARLFPGGWTFNLISLGTNIGPAINVTKNY